ncbi:hypothetical protein D3C85_13530 [compost metagenome]
MSVELYNGPDRGHFRVQRLEDDTGTQLNAKCRIKDASCFVYLSDLHYAIVGYSIEWWHELSQAPHEGGIANVYAPKGRPQATKMYFRMKSSNISKMLYLEDAIINDFLSSKVLADPQMFNSYTQEAAEQIASAAVWRELGKTPFSFNNGVHIARYETTANTPLTDVGQGLVFDWKLTGSDTVNAGECIGNYVFTRERDCYTKLVEYLTARGVQ